MSNVYHTAVQQPRRLYFRDYKTVNVKTTRPNLTSLKPKKRKVKSLPNQNYYENIFLNILNNMNISKGFYDLCIPYNKDHKKISKILEELHQRKFYNLVNNIQKLRALLLMFLE